MDAVNETGRQRAAATGTTAGTSAGPSSGDSSGTAERAPSSAAERLPPGAAERSPGGAAERPAEGSGAEADGASRVPATPGQRPLWVTGLVGAVWSIGIGLAVLTTITLVGWIAAPRTAFGHGLPGVFRTAVNFWLVSHHAGFSVDGGRVGLLPLGVLLIPGALLYRTGGWMIRRVLPRDAAGRPVASGRTDARRAVVGAAVALAVPYAALAGLLALAASSTVARPSPWQAVVACFVVAATGGGAGAARTIVAARTGRRVRSGLGALVRLLPDRPRSLVIGVAGSVAVLLATGAVLVGASLAVHSGEAARQFDLLAPGIVGGVLLVLVQVAFLPNAVIWGMAYAIGPGFAVGSGTSVAATGVLLDIVPVFPPLAALPQPGPAPVVSLVALAAPFLAGAVGGVLTVRAMPSTASEAAPLWGFASGALTGVVTAVLAALSGGPLGGARMATVGPSWWQVGLFATLEVGISAAIAAWLANWRILRRADAPDVPAAEPVRQDTPEPSRRESRRERRRSEAAEAGVPAPSSTPSTPSLPSLRPQDETPTPPPTPQPPASPYPADALEFEEAEPVLAPRRPARSRPRPEDDLPDLVDEPTPPPTPVRAPAPAPAPRAVEHASEPEITPEPAPEPAETDVPRQRHDEPERTETRGGAIYVLRDDPRDQT
ncbi:DUF6350 family protein [Actinomadura oligospora]|uniref:cell division protein PerM n=1 Tax=Actinomadura oligospora TaxID=111804 RepID=UPI0004AFCBF1|nr:DUF6350 family protein [Actinomadura oligospora]